MELELLQPDQAQLTATPARPPGLLPATQGWAGSPTRLQLLCPVRLPVAFSLEGLEFLQGSRSCQCIAAGSVTFPLGNSPSPSFVLQVMPSVLRAPLTDSVLRLRAFQIEEGWVLPQVLDSSQILFSEEEVNSTVNFFLGLPEG